MTHCTRATAIELKAAGFPQPSPQPGQWWWSGENSYMVCALNHNIEVVLSAVGRYSMAYRRASTFPKFGTFAPDLDYIAARLKPGFMFEIRDGLPSCSNCDEAEPVRTQANTFAEAAALMWLAQNDFENEPPARFSRSSFI